MPIIIVALLGTGFPLIYSIIAPAIPITVILLATKQKKNHAINSENTRYMYCTKCGEKIPSSNNYCTKCGTAVG